LALWKIINEEDAVLIPKKSRRELFQRIFALGRAKDLSAPLHSVLQGATDVSSASITEFISEFVLPNSFPRISTETAAVGHLVFLALKKSI
jgi:hypothetical protein